MPDALQNSCLNQFRIDSFSGGLKHAAQLSIAIHQYKYCRVDEQIIGVFTFTGFLFNSGQFE